MTSWPASRNARAMTLAPRSWPSKPGLAISTRIGDSARPSDATPGPLYPASATMPGYSARDDRRAACRWLLLSRQPPTAPQLSLVHRPPTVRQPPTARHLVLVRQPSTVLLPP